jgi:hypothetical protein
VGVFDEKLRRELTELEPGGVIAYTPLMVKLEECADDPAEWRRIVVPRLPYALGCALQDAVSLQDIRKVADRYPELVPDILTAALKLRMDSGFRDWTERESTEYRAFVSKLEELVLDRRNR